VSYKKQHRKFFKDDQKRTRVIGSASTRQAQFVHPSRNQHANAHARKSFLQLVKLQHQRQFISDKQLEDALSTRDRITPPATIGDLKLIDWGGHRYVYDIGNGYVIKVTVPTDKNHLHNQWEAEAYRDSPEQMKELLCPVVVHSEDYKWLIMPKVKTEKTGLSDLAAGVAMLDIKDELKKDGRNWVATDLEPRQVGLMGEKPVIVDYGFGMECYT
jgi:hypothetical protein